MTSKRKLRVGELRVEVLLVVLLYAVCGVMAYESTVERRAFAEALVWSVTDLHEGWELQATTDLTNWFSVIKAGELAPRRFTIEIENTNHAQFYRIR